jgi:dTDP-4-amino-4,6-dideoxygalactose transaminase
MEAIPFMDLQAQYLSIREELTKAIADVIESKQFIQGPWAERFAKEFLKTHGGRFGVGCANGTSAITVALRALNVGPGDEVLVPNNTFFGTAEPVVEVGARPVLVDTVRGYYGFNLEELEGKITSKTKAIIAVHLYGNPEAIDQISEICKRRNLRLIEDCAQAHMAKFKEQPVGTFGDIATFSFYPGKNLGAYGDAGFILTENEKLFEFVSRYIDHGRTEKYVHEFFGGNFRLDALQAAVLSVKTAHLDRWTGARRSLAKSYDDVLKPRGYQVIETRAKAYAVNHLYVVEVANRTEVLEHFKNCHIGCGVHYPVTLNQQPAFRQFGYERGQFPTSEAACERILSLPLFPEMSSAQQQHVVREFLQVARP